MRSARIISRRRSGGIGCLLPPHGVSPPHGTDRRCSSVVGSSRSGSSASSVAVDLGDRRDLVGVHVEGLGGRGRVALELLAPPPSTRACCFAAGLAVERPRGERAVRDRARRRLPCLMRPGAAEVVGVRVRDDRRCGCRASLNPAVLQPLFSAFHDCGPGQPGVDDGEAAVVEQAVHVHVARAPASRSAAACAGCRARPRRSPRTPAPAPASCRGLGAASGHGRRTTSVTSGHCGVSPTRAAVDERVASATATGSYRTRAARTWARGAAASRSAPAAKQSSSSWRRATTWSATGMPSTSPHGMLAAGCPSC